MPYIHWEEKSIYKNYRASIETVEVRTKLRKPIPAANRPSVPKVNIQVSSNLNKERTILQQDLKNGRWQVRRSLDQSYYSSLEDTFERDNDQVVDRFARGLRAPGGKELWPSEHEPILMVHQLWLWVVDGKMQIHTSLCQKSEVLSRHISDCFSSEVEWRKRQGTAP